MTNQYFYDHVNHYLTNQISETDNVNDYRQVSKLVAKTLLKEKNDDYNWLVWNDSKLKR
jgi:hypothetical protein